MGIKNLTTLLKAIYAELPATEQVVENVSLGALSGSTIIIDHSMVAFQHGALSHGTLKEMNSHSIRGFISLLMTLKRANIRPIVVFDQAQPDLNVYDVGNRIIEELTREGSIEPMTPSRSTIIIHSSVSIPSTPTPASSTTTASTSSSTSESASTSSSTSESASSSTSESVSMSSSTSESASMSASESKPVAAAAPVVNFATIMQAKSQTRDSRRESRETRKEETHQDQFFVSAQLVNVIELICQLIGVTALRPLVEADWLMAALARCESEVRPTYIITEDTDFLAYDIGKAKVLRHNTLNGQPRLMASEYQCVDQRRIWELVGLTDPIKRAYLAVILGCDYYNGIRMIGPKSILHVLQIDPRFVRSTRMKGSTKKKLAQLLLQYPSEFREDGLRWSILPEQLGSSVRSEFNKRYVSPSAFNGISADDIRAYAAATDEECMQRGPIDIPIQAVDAFLERVWTYRIQGEDAVNFHQAVEAFNNGPMIESRRLLKGGCAYKVSEKETSFGNPSLPIEERTKKIEQLRKLVEEIDDNIIGQLQILEIEIVSSKVAAQCAMLDSIL